MNSPYENIHERDVKKFTSQTYETNNIEWKNKRKEENPRLYELSLAANNEMKKNDFLQANNYCLISQQCPNIQFHQKKEGFIDRITQSHIQNWKNYKENSVEIQMFYKDLERDHAFIQWIFPNFFTSMFNPQSRRLTLEERNQIIANQEYTAFYLDNFRMFMRFLGIEAIINNDSNCQFNLIDETQFKVCVFQNTHNLMRLQRVFASLSVLGQRQLALNFLHFLKYILKCFNDSRIYNRDYQHFDIVKKEEEQDNQFNIRFQQTKNYYFQKDLLEIWDVDTRILTDDYIYEKDILKPKVKPNSIQNEDEDEDENENHIWCPYCDFCKCCACCNCDRLCYISIGCTLVGIILSIAWQYR